MREETVLVEEIWVKTNKPDEASAIGKNGENLKLVAFLVNGYPLRLDEGYFLERRGITKKEADLLTNNKE